MSRQRQSETSRKALRRGLVLILWLGIVTIATEAGAATMLINGIRALVHDSVIIIDEVEMMSLPAEALLARQYQNQPAVFEAKVAEVKSNNLAQLIDRQLILHEF